MYKNAKWMVMFILTCVFIIFPLGSLTPHGNTSKNCQVEAATKKQFKLSEKQYKKVKGWWSDNSSGGWDVKFTHSKVKYYDRVTGKLAWTATIKKCKKKGNVYVYYIKSEKGCYEYRTTTYDLNVLEYYESWDDENYGDYYSGSSSLSRGKWK